MKAYLNHNLSSLMRLAFILVNLFVFQISIANVYASSVNLGSNPHDAISEAYTYGEIKSSNWVESGHNGRVNWALSKSETGINGEVLVYESSVAARGVTNAIPKGKLANHLFKGTGKLVDNPANRALIQKISNGKSLGVDQYGKSWFAKTLDNGTQIYTYTRNGVVKGAGINQTPVDIIARYGLK